MKKLRRISKFSRFTNQLKRRTLSHRWLSFTLRIAVPDVSRNNGRLRTRNTETSPNDEIINAVYTNQSQSKIAYHRSTKWQCTRGRSGVSRSISGLAKCDDAESIRDDYQYINALLRTNERPSFSISLHRLLLWPIRVRYYDYRCIAFSSSYEADAVDKVGAGRPPCQNVDN